MPIQTIGIIVNGATGRICSTQHLKNSLIAIRDQGGLAVGDKQVIPHPMLVGRDAARLAEVARTYGVADWTTDLDKALADAAFPVFFDAAATGGRLALLKKAVAAGKHIYAEKPVVPSVADGRALLAAAQARGLKHGAVEDKLYLPGFRKLARVLNEGTLGRIVGFKLEFGWWVFDGVEAPTQRPSWNYRRATGGGLVLDMFPHWRYVIEGLLGRIGRVAAAAARHAYQSGAPDVAVDLATKARAAFLEADRPLDALAVTGVLGDALSGLGRCSEAIGLLDQVGLARFFSVVAGGDTLPVRKPDGRHLAWVVERLGDGGRAAMVGDGRNHEAKNELDGHADIENVEHKTDDDHLIVTLAEGISDGSFIADILVRNGYRLKMLKEEAIDLEDVFMGITKGITQ